MKLIAALSFLSVAAATGTAKTAMIRKLLQVSTPTLNSQLRRLDQNNQVDLVGYNLKFEQCQFVKSYDQQMAEDSSTETVLGTKRFVIFRLCPGDCSACNSNYGEYLVDLDTYLYYTVAFFQAYQDNMCNACKNCNNNNDDANNNNNNNNDDAVSSTLKKYNTDCATCYDECQKIGNMQANGYIDATEFLDCQMIYDPQDDSKGTLYGGPICASAGGKIKIGVFTDQYCLNLDSSKDVDDYLVGNNGQQMKLSHALLKSTYTDTCISCNQNSLADDNNAADEVTQLCETLYTDAAKCETPHGINSGYTSSSSYDNQASQEQVVCDFIQSMKSGTYDEQGEIVLTGAQSSTKNGKSTTGGQKFALTFFTLGTVALAVYAAMLHAKLVKGGKADFTSSGGAMA